MSSMLTGGLPAGGYTIHIYRVFRCKVELDAMSY